MADVTESGELAAEGGERPPATEPKGEPGTSQESVREPGASQEGAGEPGTGQETSRESGSSQEGTRDPNTTQKGTRDPNSPQEGTRDPNSPQEGTSNLNTTQEGTRDLNTPQEGTRDLNTTQEGTSDLNTTQEGTRDPNSPQEGTRDLNTTQEGIRDPNTTHEGTLESTTESTREPGVDQKDTKEPSPEGTSEPSPEGTRELSPSQEGIRGPSTSPEDVSAGQMEDADINTREELGGDASEPSHETDEPEVTEDMAQEEEEDPRLQVEDQEGGQEAAEQDSELQEMVDDEQVREELTHQYHALVQDRDKVQQHNAQLQHKLYEYFRKKKGEEMRAETSKQAADQEQRYLKYLSTLEEMRRKHQEEAALNQQQIEELRAQCQDIVSKVDKEWTAFQEQKKKIALCSISKRGAGKNAASSLIQEIELLQSREERKEKEVIQVRLENIKLKNQINRHESTLRSKEELAEGLHLIDFEQLKIENQTYNEKIEERNEELLKLRKKITNTVQVLTHVKEKLQYVQAENQEQKEKLMEVEAIVGNKRDILTKTKQARDSLRMENLKLKQKCGLLGNKVLLRDFEDKVDATEELRQTLENLKRRHAELTLSSKGLMKKVDETRQDMDN